MKTDEDKFSAIWLSHSSMSDFMTCPRLYYYVNIYKNPLSGRKITIMNPHFALGQVVHGVIEELSSIPAEERTEQDLLGRFNELWASVEGKKGGFSSEKQEEDFKQRGRDMIERVKKSPGPLMQKTIKLKQDLPHFWLSEEHNFILCGKIDWIEYVEDEDSIRIIDFKTGKRKEKEDSLQLPIYFLLAKNCQTRDIAGISYWYLHEADTPDAVPLPDYDESVERIMKIGQRIQLARQLNHFKCSVDEKNGCRACAQYEAVVQGKGEFVGVGEFNKEVYILPETSVTL